MEYMAAGKPVVVTNGGGSSELITDGVQGFLVPPAQPLAVAEKIELLAGDSVKGRQMGLAGRKRIEQRFSIKQMTDATIRMYRETLAGTASKS
jgi:glycosyltransferase involved in cell wall biosynthesis